MSTSLQSNPACTHTMSIYRHCMQELLHEAINNAATNCVGILTGNGNIITNKQAVTHKGFARLISDHASTPNSSILGAYTATDRHGNIHPDSIQNFKTLQQQHPLAPFYYLILHMDHKGRIDAHMYDDIERQQPITLLMQECISAEFKSPEIIS